MKRLQMICFRLLTIGIVVTLLASLPNNAMAQRNRAEIATDLIRRMDQNGDGHLDAKEIPPNSRKAISRLAEQAGLEEDQPWPVRQLERQLRRSPKQESNDESSNDPATTSSPSPQQSSVSESFRFGGGSTQTTGSVRGFGDNATDGKRLEETYDPRVLNSVDAFLRRYDRNQNGQLDSAEWGRVSWGNDPKASDKNGDGILSRAELTERMAKRWGGSSSSRSQSRGNSQSAAKPSPSSPSRVEQAKIDRYAKSLLQQYDTSGNGVLEKEEWSKMTARYAASDANDDGVITARELAIKIGNFSQQSRTLSKRSNTSERRSSRESRRRETSRRRNRRDREQEPSEKKSYRFLTATERLADSLSDRQQESFVKLDRNGDGQIAMAEFATVWSDSKVKEFNQLDRNLDGLVTPQEYVSDN